MQKVQSVVFKKPNFDLNKCVNWLVKNNFQIKKVDETKNTFRFRQIAPQLLRREGYNNYKTVSIDPNIDLVIAFKAV